MSPVENPSYTQFLSTKIESTLNFGQIHCPNCNRITDHSTGRNFKTLELWAICAICLHRIARPDPDYEDARFKHRDCERKVEE